MLFLALLFVSISSNGYTAFWQTFMKIDVFFDPDLLPQDALETADYPGLVKQSLRNMFPDVKSRKEKRMLYKLVSTGASYQLRDMVLQNPALIGQTHPVWVPADDDVDMFVKGHFDRDLPEDERRIKDNQLAWLDSLTDQQSIKEKVQYHLFHGR